MPRHVVLTGDSIFDNAAYVPGEDCLIDQLRAEMPHEWYCTLLARDGAMIEDVVLQLEQLPPDATDIVISVGGNDALRHADLLDQVRSRRGVRKVLAPVLPRFRSAYAVMLDEVLSYGAKTTVCTIYDQCPLDVAKWRELVPIALSDFNTCIEEEAARRHVSVIDLREICVEPEDYSAVSPIEPSSLGGLKIVYAIIRHLLC